MLHSFIIKRLVSSERVQNNCDSPLGIYNICECLVVLRPGAVLTFLRLSCLCFIGNSGTSLLLFFEGYIY